MKSIQKIIIIKALVIISVSLLVLNIFQFDNNNNNNNNVINLKQRDIKFFVDKNNQISNNNFNNKQEPQPNPININTNDNNKNSIFDIVDSSQNKEKNEHQLAQSSSSLSSPSSLSPDQDAPHSSPFSDNTSNDAASAESTFEMVYGEAPKYSNRFCHDENKIQDLDSLN